MNPLHFIHQIEPLEERIAPATLLNPTTVTYQDTDGDDVTVKLSKPLFNSASINAVLKFDVGAANGTKAAPDNGQKQQLLTIDLTAIATPAEAEGVSITVSATKSRTNGGNGLADVGYIKAPGFDLGAVTVEGDLDQLWCGGFSASKPGVKAITAKSIGASPQNAVSLSTIVVGRVGTLSVAANVEGAFIQADGFDKILIGGSLVGHAADNTGLIQSAGDIGSVSVKGDVSGGGWA